MTRLIAFAAALLFSSTAFAGDQVFRWSSQELASIDGIKSVHRRAEDQARAFCSEFLRGTRGLSRQARCFNEIVDEIVGSVNDQRLTAYAKTGRVDPDLLAAADPAGAPATGG